LRIEEVVENGQAQNIRQARFAAEGARRYHAIHKKMLGSRQKRASRQT